MTNTMESLTRIIAEKKLYAVFQPILSLHRCGSWVRSPVENQ